MIDWKKIKKIEFQDLKRATVTHEVDKCQRAFNMKGRSMNWIGFGFVDEGEAQDNDILVYDKED